MSTTALFENYMKWLASFSLKNAEGGKLHLLHEVESMQAYGGDWLQVSFC